MKFKLKLQIREKLKQLQPNILLLKKLFTKIIIFVHNLQNQPVGIVYLVDNNC